MGGKGRGSHRTSSSESQPQTGLTEQLGEVKLMSVGVSRYPSGRVEKQADRRATGPLVARLQGFGNLLCFVAGAWADCSTHLHELIVTCAKSQVAHMCQSTGRLELDGQLGTITGQY